MSKRDDRFPASTVRRRSSWTRRHCRDIFRRHDVLPELPRQRDHSERRHNDRYRARRDISTTSTNIDLSTASLGTAAYPFTTTIVSPGANLTIVEILELATTSSASQTEELALPNTNAILPPGVATDLSDNTPTGIVFTTSTTEITQTSISGQGESTSTSTESETSSATSLGNGDSSSSEGASSTSTGSTSLPASGSVPQIASITRALESPALPSISLGLPTSASPVSGILPPSVVSVNVNASLGKPQITSAISSILSSTLTESVISIPTHQITLNVTSLLSSLLPTLPSSILIPTSTTIIPLITQNGSNATVAATSASALQNLTRITTLTFAPTFPGNVTTFATITTIPQSSLSTIVPVNQTSTTFPPAIIPTNLTLTVTVSPTAPVNLTTTASSAATTTFISTTESSNSTTSSTSLISLTSSSSFLSPSIGSPSVSSSGTPRSSLSATSLSTGSFSSSSEFSSTIFQTSVTFTPGPGGPSTIFPTSSTASTPSSRTSNVVPLVPAIVGSIGGIALLTALGMLLFLYRRRLTLSRLASGPAYVGGSEGEPQLMTERGFTVLSGQRLDTGVSGGTPIVYRQPGAQTGDTRGRSVSATPSRFTEHL